MAQNVKFDTISDLYHMSKAELIEKYSLYLNLNTQMLHGELVDTICEWQMANLSLFLARDAYPKPARI